MHRTSPPKTPATPVLDRIKTTADLHALNEVELRQLADELRAELLHSVAQTGGHLSAGLGVVELTVALHHVFHTPQDKLVWDTGHQCYPHKILTGRRAAMSGLRQYKGIAGFPNIEESPYDTFGVGHSSTSISAALGMALAARYQQQDSAHVAIIGDGAMTAGMAFEALNHAGGIKADLLVVLNDNNMSISANVGALSHSLARLLSSRMYTRVRERGKRILQGMPMMQDLARRTEEHMKGMVAPGTLFEELGFNYIGPVDGHDLPVLVKTLHNLKRMRGPRLLHIITQKGKGFNPAEQDPCGYHGVGPAKQTSAPPTKNSEIKSYTEVFGCWAMRQAERDPRFVVITPAMCEGSGLRAFAERFPDRLLDVGIAEQHAITLAAGLARSGMRPVVAIYSTFLQRAYDQWIHDVVLQKLPVMLVVDRAGIVGPDGATHAGLFDHSFLSCLPGVLLMAPSDADHTWRALHEAWQQQGPAVVRFPKQTAGFLVADQEPDQAGPSVSVLRCGKKLAILSYGALLDRARILAEQLDASLLDVHVIKPLDIEALQQHVGDHSHWVTLEDNQIQGGAGSLVQQAVSLLPSPPRVLCLGVPDIITEHGSREQLLDLYGLSSDAMAVRIRAWMDDQEQA